MYNCDLKRFLGIKYRYVGTAHIKKNLITNKANYYKNISTKWLTLDHFLLESIDKVIMFSLIQLEILLKRRREIGIFKIFIIFLIHKKY